MSRRINPREHPEGTIVILREVPTLGGDGLVLRGRYVINYWDGGGFCVNINDDTGRGRWLCHERFETVERPVVR